MWGVLSDKYGRKPIIIIGTLGAAVGSIVFGSSKLFVSIFIQLSQYYNFPRVFISSDTGRPFLAE